MKFTSVRALFWLADKEARERISVDAVRSVGPLSMIRREMNRTAVAARVRGASSAGHLCTTEVEGNTVLQPVVHFLFCYQATSLVGQVFWIFWVRPPVKCGQMVNTILPEGKG